MEEGEQQNNGDNAPYLTISELSRAVKTAVETAFEFVRVRAEVSRPNKAPSGHLYFTLKDDRSTLAAVCWKTMRANLAIQPEEGLEVIVTGRLTTFAGQSKYQIVVSQMEVAGEGALLKQLEDRRRMLASEGLFDADRKKKIPKMPAVIGVVTSPTGEESRIVLEELGNGLAAGQIAVSVPGIYHFDDGTRTAVAGAGTINLIEFADVTATDRPLRPTASATGGGITWLADNGVPDLRQNRAGRAQADTPSGGGSARWLAFQRNNALAVRGVRNVPLLPALLLLIVIGGMLVGAWRLESR